MRRTSTTLLLLVGISEAVAGEPVAGDQAPWWLGPLVTIIAAIIGALAIVLQLGRQHRNESARQTENLKGQLRLQVYQEFSARLSTAADALGTAAMYAFTGPTHAEIFGNQSARGFTPNPIPDRALKFLEVNSAAANEVTEVVSLIEKYFIIHPDLDVFRMALSAGSHDLRSSFHALFQYMLTHFPMDVQTPGGPKVDNIKVLSPEEFEQLKGLATAYHGAATDLDCYLMDMRVELQTLFLSYLFPNTVPRRRPADPSKKVITLAPLNVKSLRQHFLRNTEWGKNAVNSELEVHREFHGRT